MPAVSKKQQRFFGMVRAAQKGEAKAPSPEVSRVASRIKKSDAKDFASTKHKGLPMKKKGLSEEGYDRMRDAALEKGTWKGGGGQPSTGGAKKTKGKTVLQKETEKKYGKGKSALDIVKKNITDKYGKDAIMKTKNEGTSYGITRGSGKPSGQMAAFGKQDKKENPYSIKNKLKMVIKGAAEKNRKKAGVTSEAVYTGPDKKDRAVINKMYDKKGNKTDFAKKAAEYEKNMDPKKRQALKDKATKGMKFTHEEAVSEAKYEAGASDYGKTSIRNKRAFGKGGNAADPKERGGAKMLRHDSHTKRRGVKKNNKYGATNKPPVDGAPSDEFKKDRYASMRTEAKVDMKTPDYKRATVRDKRYGNPHGSHELGGGIRKDRRADHEAKRGVKTKGNNPVKDESVRQRRSPGLQLSSFSIIEKLKMTRKEYGKIHKDFKSDDPKKPRTTKYVPGKGTVSMPVELTDELHPNVAKNDAINKANAMKRAKEREAKKPSADVIAARKRQYKGGSDYTTADKKKVIQSYKEEVTAKERMKRDAGAIAKKKMRNKEHRKYVNFLDVDESVAISEKIKYDKKGSSMDYFLGKDPKKTDEYKKSKKKNESSCECKHESFKDWLQEGNNTARMLHKSKTQVTGNVSADRGSDEKKNQASRKGLEKDLKKKGIGYKKGVGKYKYDSGETGTEVSYQTSKPDKMSKRRFGKTMRRLGRKHGQESVITKDKNKPARLHDTESKKPGKSINVGKSKGGSNPSGMGQTSGDKVRSGKLPSKSKKGAYHYG
tara:strand:- start:2204 stop:4519 length:2316 start_codon:yes stop_codon:yes gene_type:complete